MKILFAVSNESISNTIIKKYESMYKEIISSKNVYYFNAILKELQKDKSYDRIVISEELEPFTNKNYDSIDNFIFEKLDRISDEAVTNTGEDIPIILIATDRRTAGESLLSKLFGIGVYSTLIGQDRSIAEVCKLINKPRSKKEAKIYYKIDSSDVDYKAETEDDVSEIEIQNILTHYKRLGKNEEKYVESFNSIASQYTDEQLKLIVKFLPIGVKAVLESNCPKYQQIAMSSGESMHLKRQQPYNSTQINPKTNKPRSTDKAIVDSGIKIESIKGVEPKKMTKPVVIPTTVSTKNVKKIQKNTNNVLATNTENIEKEPIKTNKKEIVEPIKANKAEIVEPVKRGRGRPKKVVEQKAEEIPEQPKRKRGRPKKVVEEKLEEIEIKEENVLPGFDTEEMMFSDYENNEQEEMLPGFENNDQEEMLPGFEENEQEEILPGFEENNEEEILPGFEEHDQDENVLSFDNEISSKQEQEDTFFDWEEPTQINSNRNIQTHQNNIINENIEEKQIGNYQNTSNYNLENLLTANKKIVAFVGTTKNGTSFLINNIAETLSNQGIKTAILDLTQNRNSYYIYTKNEEGLRKRAIECIDKLINGVAEGIPVNKNLDVYTALPGENSNLEESDKILSTLLNNYNLILLDCDFNTNYDYIRKIQELYLVQSMDVLTIQPLTAYLRDLKAKNVLDPNKLRIVINKYTKVRSVTEKTIIAGMAFYNDPSMSFMTELFNREKVLYTIIPFEMQTYSKYLEGLINCSITTHGYSKEFANSLKRLSEMVYPLINNTSNKYNNPKYNKYATNNNFSNNMNNTLNKMKRDF